VPLVAWVLPDAIRPAAPIDAAGSQRGASLPGGLGAQAMCHGLFGFGYVVTAMFIVAATPLTVLGRSRRCPPEDGASQTLMNPGAAS